MNRRSLLAALVGLPAAHSLVPSSSARAPEQSRRRYGRVDVQAHRAHLARTGETLHVYVDRRDVTLACHEVDDAEGWARCYFRDPDDHRAWLARGGRYAGEGPILILHGEIRIAPGPAFDEKTPI